MGAAELMLRDFPLLLPEDATLSRYHGFITAHGVDYRVRFTVPAAAAAAVGGGGLAGAALHGPPELCALLEAHGAMAMLEQRLVRAASVHEFFVELRELVERLHSAEPSAGGGGGGAAAATGSLPLTLDPAVYARLVEEISEVGWSRVTRVEEGGGNELRLALELDVDGRVHVLSVALPPSYPAASPRCAAALPQHVELVWSADTGSRLKDAVAQYTSAISSYHDVWTELDEIDREAWVIEPEAPTRANLHRRLALGPRSSVQVTLDPSPGCARAVPEIRFFGSEAAVAPLRASLNRALHAWSLSRSVVENLRGMLGVNLPSADDAREAKAKAASGEGGEEGDSGQSAPCAICYAYTLDDEIPAVVCDNVHCARPYHRACLLEWLRALPESRTSFDTVFGACPYCSEAISAKTHA